MLKVVKYGDATESIRVSHNAPTEIHFKIHWQGKGNQGVSMAETAAVAATQIQEAKGFGATTISIFLDGREITDLDFAALVAFESTDPSDGL